MILDDKLDKLLTQQLVEDFELRRRRGGGRRVWRRATPLHQRGRRPSRLPGRSAVYSS